MQLFHHSGCYRIERIPLAARAYICLHKFCDGHLRISALLNTFRIGCLLFPSAQWRTQMGRQWGRSPQIRDTEIFGMLLKLLRTCLFEYNYYHAIVVHM